MFEVDVAKEYLFPRWRRLSLSIISLIALLVVTLVVWLILAFFSVTTSLEKGWMEKLVTLSSPVRISPNEAYFKTTYYLLDSISADADYTSRSLEERAKEESVLYNPEEDAEIPGEWVKEDKSLVGELIASIDSLKTSVPDLKSSFYEAASLSLRLHLKRAVNGDLEESTLSQSVYALSLDQENSRLGKTLLTPTRGDLSNLGRKVSFKGPELVRRLGNYVKDDAASFVCDDSGCRPLWVAQDQSKWFLPDIKGWGKGILVPRQYRDAGVLLGDEGFIHYEMATLTSKQEVKHPVFVAGFYDPGLLGMGGKFLIADKKLLSLVRSQTHQDGVPGSEGIALRFGDLDRAEEIKNSLVADLKAKGIASYFKVETYKDFEFVRPLLQELGSQKNLFTILSLLILVVACSNIISLLIILVHDKKKEIAIMRALGASIGSVGFIFAFSGLLIGIAGSLLGVGLTLVTLRFIPDLLDFLSWLQGFSAFQTFFGTGRLEISLSKEALFWVIGMTSLLSLVSGLVPAIKACRLKPSEALKSE